jgi:hypothetical protein
LFIINCFIKDAKFLAKKQIIFQEIFCKKTIKFTKIVLHLSIKLKSMISDQQIKDLLEPHQKHIRLWYDEALIRLEQIKEIMGVEVYKRLTADVINNYVLEKAKAYFHEIKDVEDLKIDDRYKSLVIFFNKHSAAGKFRKLDKNTLLSVGKLTGIFKHIVQGSLFVDVQPTVALEVGYMFNSTGTDYERIVVVKRVDKKIAIPIFEINQNDVPEMLTITAQEIILDIENDEQLSIKKAQ